jgi:hypothetical protein
MKNRFARLLLPTALVCAAFAVPFQGNGWKEYAYPQDGFSVSAPATPKMEREKTQSAAGGNVELHYYGITLAGDSGFMVVVSPVLPNDQRSPQQVLADAKKGAVDSVNGKLISETSVSLGSNPGIQIEFEAGDHHSRNRYYVVGKKLYQLAALAPQGKPIPADTDRFFGSFQLVK